MRNIFAVAVLCAASGAWAQTVISFDGQSEFDPQRGAMVYHEGGYTFTSIATPVEGNDHGRGNFWTANGSELRSSSPPPSLGSTVTMTHDNGATFRLFSLDVRVDTFDYCIQQPPPLNGEPLFITGSLAGVQQISSFNKLTNCHAFVTLASFADTQLDSLTFNSPQQLSFIVVDNVVVGVPEPTSYALIGLGLLLTPFARRRYASAERKCV